MMAWVIRWRCAAPCHQRMHHAAARATVATMVRQEDPSLREGSPEHELFFSLWIKARKFRELAEAAGQFISQDYPRLEHVPNHRQSMVIS